ncbi:MAG TPA: hypothetical protein VJ957_10650 [Longimicrobiales bacterium]|nr:hypothetical protein [Longimicrobiales bacterium]
MVASSASSVRVLDGALTVLRLYDVAYGIDIVRVETLAAGGTSRPRLVRAEPKAMTYGVESLELALEPVVLPGAGDGARSADVRVRLYDFGAVSLRLTTALADLTWEDYVAAALDVDRATKPAAAPPFWAGQLERLRTLIAPALIRPSAANLEEDFLIATVRSTRPALPAEDLLRLIDPVPLLSGETTPLSDGARAELLRNRFSYYTDDLAILTWDRALLVEPRGDTDVADVLEVANAQLLELRYYDELLDDELPRMYGRVNRVRGTLAPRALRHYGRLARELHTLVAEVTELTERVDNALKVTEDVYLARIYAAAIELFRVRAWNAAVDRKLAIIRDTYQALFDEAAAARAELLEATIVLLIVFEIVLALL